MIYTNKTLCNGIIFNSILIVTHFFIKKVAFRVKNFQTFFHQKNQVGIWNRDSQGQVVHDGRLMHRYDDWQTCTYKWGEKVGVEPLGHEGEDPDPKHGGQGYQGHAQHSVPPDLHSQEKYTVLSHRKIWNGSWKQRLCHLQLNFHGTLKWKNGRNYAWL